MFLSQQRANFLFLLLCAYICLVASQLAVYGIDYTTRLGGLDIISLRTSEDIIGVVNISTQDLEASYAAQCDFVNSPTGQDQIVSDISNLGANIMSIHVECYSSTMRVIILFMTWPNV